MSLDLGVEYHFREKLFIRLTPFIEKGLNEIEVKIMSSEQLTHGCYLGFYLKIYKGEDT